MFTTSVAYSQVGSRADYSNIRTVLDENDPKGLFREAGERPTCGPASFVKDEPMLVSGLMKNYDEQIGTRRLTEPLTSPGAKEGTVTSVGVPAFSILKPLNLVDFANASSTRVKVPVAVRVISLPNEQALNEMRTSKFIKRAVNGVTIAEEGAEGNMKLGAVHSVSDYVFKVKDHKVLSAFPNIEDELREGSVRFVEDRDTYLARECCVGDQCRKQYAFEIISDRTSQAGEKYFDNTPGDALFQTLFPVLSENLSAMTGILNLIEEPQFKFIDFRYFDTRGFVKIPLDLLNKFMSTKGDVVPEMQTGPLNSLHYMSDDPNANDAFGHPLAICAFFQAVKRFNKSCNRASCRVQWGDFYHSDKWYTHNQHHGGTCVDVRPMRKNEGYGPLNYFSSVRSCKKNAEGKQVCKSSTVINSEYDRAKTQELVNAFLAAGGVGVTNDAGTVTIPNILFNDNRGIKGVTRYPGHSNHLHVCFPTNSAKVQRTCAEGL